MFLSSPTDPRRHFGSTPCSPSRLRRRRRPGRRVRRDSSTNLRGMATVLLMFSASRSNFSGSLTLTSMGDSLSASYAGAPYGVGYFVASLERS